MTPHLTVKQVAERLGISRSQVYTLVADGSLPSYRFGKRGAIRVSEEQLASFLEATKFKPPGAELPEFRHIVECWRKMHPQNVNGGAK